MLPNHLSVFRSNLLPKMVGPYEEVKSMVCASLHVRRLHNKETCNEQGVLTCPLGFILKKKKEKKNQSNGSLDFGRALPKWASLQTESSILAFVVRHLRLHLLSTQTLPLFIYLLMSI